MQSIIEHQTNLVVLVDPERTSATLHSLPGVTVIDGDGTLEHPALPGFAIRVRDIFAKPKPRS